MLDETFTRVFGRGPVSTAATFCDRILSAAELNLLSIERISVPRFEEAYKLRKRYRDKPRISFTDLTSFVIMRELGISQILTGDAHFEQVNLGFRRLPRR